ncbi:hypothetical protein AN1V17_06350 [Vallitalea sediminicola]
MFKRISTLIVFVVLLMVSSISVSAKTVTVGEFKFNTYDINGYETAEFAVSKEKFVTKDGKRLLIVEKNKKQGLINVQGTVILPLNYDYIDCFYGDYVVVYKNDFAGVVNYKTGKQIVEFNNYNFIHEYSGYYVGSRRDGTSESLNEQWQVLSIDVYRRFREHYIVQKNYLQALFDLDENQITTFQYDIINPFEYKGISYFIVEKDNAYGMIDDKGKVLLDYKYYWFSKDKDSSIINLKNLEGKEYVYDLDTLALIKDDKAIGYEDFHIYNDKYYFFRENNSSGVMDKNYKVIERINEPRAVSRYINGLYEVLDGPRNRYLSTYTYKDAKGKVESNIYDYADDYISDSEYIVVNKFDKRPTRYYEYCSPPLFGINFYCGDELLKPHYGVINSKGEEILPCIYDRIYNYGYFLDGLFMVEKDDKYGYVNAKNEVVVPIEYKYTTRLNVVGEEADRYIVVVGKGEKFGLIDNKGELVYQCKLDNDVLHSKDGIIITTQNGRWGAIDLKGNVVIPFIYETEKSYEFRNGLAIFAEGVNSISHDLDTGKITKKVAKTGVLTNRNEIVIPFGDFVSTSSDYKILISKTPKGLRVYEMIASPFEAENNL